MIKITYDRGYNERLSLNHTPKGNLEGIFSHQSLEDWMQTREGDTHGKTREGTARSLRGIFPNSLVTIGGHHVAVHSSTNGERMFILESDAPDFN